VHGLRLRATAPRLQKRCTKIDVRIFAGGGGCTIWGGGEGVAFSFRGGAASTEIASWGAAGWLPGHRRWAAG
jgi:hypothetical protein